MASAMRVFRKFQSADGRIKIGTLSGVSVLVAVIALLVGVLPAIADGPGSTNEGVDPVPVDWGGGSGACDDDLNRLDDGTARGPSAARYEAHLNNPKVGPNGITGNDPDETDITITVDESGVSFTFTIEEGSAMFVYDVVVNGGKKSNHYEYAETSDPGAVPSDGHLTAPEKDNQPGELHNLSHINVCYDVEPTFFECGATAEPAVELGTVTLFTVVEAKIFANSENAVCEDKLGFFFADESDSSNPNVLLDFGDDAGTVVAGRMDITKDFGSPPAEGFPDLQYERDEISGRLAVIWCNVRSVVTGTNEEAQFGDEVLPPGQYPSLLDDGGNPLKDSDGKDATACKVFEGENADGIQETVVYFEFLDPNFY